VAQPNRNALSAIAPLRYRAITPSRLRSIVNVRDCELAPLRYRESGIHILTLKEQMFYNEGYWKSGFSRLAAL